MTANIASIRELRTDFRSVKRKIEQHGEIIITDHGEPAYVLKPFPKVPVSCAQAPDYYGRLLKRQPKPISLDETIRFWEEERGER